MFKPANFDNVKAAGEYTPVSAGGHHMKIMQVSETQTKDGRDMIKVAVDMDGNDSQPGYFTQEFRDDIRPTKSWPRGGTVYVVVLDKNGNCSKGFKTFINAVEKSNPGFQTQWGDNFAAQFKGRKIGGIYGDVENEWNGKRTMHRELRWFIPIDKVATARVPDPVYLENKNVIKSAPATPATPAAPATTATIEGFVEDLNGDMDLPFC